MFLKPVFFYKLLSKGALSQSRILNILVKMALFTTILISMPAEFSKALLFYILVHLFLYPYYNTNRKYPDYLMVCNSFLTNYSILE